MQGSQEEKSVSVILPIFNEAKNISSIVSTISTEMNKLNLVWEIILVDDGSNDQSWDTISQLHNENTIVKGIRFSRNFGHQYALFAGLEHANGDAVISMDADFQHPPAMIPELIVEWRKGFEIVNTIRLEQANGFVIKNLFSRYYYKVFSYLSGVNLQNGCAEFRLLDRKVVNDILKFKEEGLFLRGIIEWVGFRKTNLSYQCQPRKFGESKYSLSKMLRLAWNGISSFSTVPLRIGVITGLVISVVSFIGIAYAMYSKYIDGNAVPGWASSIAINSFLFGMLFMYLGLIAEYIGRILVEVRHRPRYLISEKIGVRNQ